MQASYAPTTGPPLMQSMPVMDEALAPIPAVPVAFDNPYQAPRAAATTASPATSTPDETLAGRGARLAAAIIDYLLVIAVAVPGFAGFVLAETRGANADLAGVAALVFVLGMGILGLLQASYIVRDGQTIGKKWMKIRIVDHVDGQVPSWPRVLGLRYIANMALRQVPFYFFADVLPIFGEDQRCIHDYIAGTKVVEVREAS